jgi:hypothetical protein
MAGQSNNTPGIPARDAYFARLEGKFNGIISGLRSVQSAYEQVGILQKRLRDIEDRRHELRKEIEQLDKEKDALRLEIQIAEDAYEATQGACNSIEETLLQISDVMVGKIPTKIVAIACKHGFNSEIQPLDKTARSLPYKSPTMGAGDLVSTSGFELDTEYVAPPLPVNAAAADTSASPYSPGVWTIPTTNSQLGARRSTRVRSAIGRSGEEPHENRARQSRSNQTGPIEDNSTTLVARKVLCPSVYHYLPG